MRPDPLLELDDVRKHYRGPSTWRERLTRVQGAELKAVDGVSLQLWPGQTLGLVGESGCGKSTLGRLAAGLIAPSHGSVRIGGAEVATRSERAAIRRQVQIIFQDQYSSLDPRQSVEASIREPLDIHGIGTAADRRRQVRQTMERVSLPARVADMYPGELSGGLRQRVGIANALVLQPDLVVADEPTSALDASIQAEILNLLADLQAELGLSYILISHNLDVVRHLSHRVAVMYLGRIVESGPTDEVFARPRHPYTEALLAAAPRPDPRAILEAPKLKGESPSLSEVPPGCAFHPRCWLARDSCAVISPPLYEFTETQRARCHVTAEASGLGTEVRVVLSSGAAGGGEAE